MPAIKIPANARRTLQGDRVLKELLDQVTPDFPPSRGSVYEDLIEAIVYQQISIKAAQSIFGRFCHHFEGSIPDPATLRNIDIDELRTLGLSGQKAAYVRNIADFFFVEQITNDQLETMPDEALIKKLTQIKGVGVWTAEMILIFSLARPDVFPVLDYGIQTAMHALYQLPDLKQRDLRGRMSEIAEGWRPYRTYGTLLLWGWKRKQMGL